MEKTISKNTLYQGGVLDLRVDDVEVPNGKKEKREFIYCNHAVCFAIKKENKYFILNQYRYATEQRILEFPAGKLEENEDIYEAVKRESIEELGYTVKNLKLETVVASSPGRTNELIYLFTGEVDTFVGQQLEDGEDLIVLELTKEEILEKAKEMIVSAKTLALLNYLK